MVHNLQCWPDIKPAMGQRLMLSGHCINPLKPPVNNSTDGKENNIIMSNILKKEMHYWGTN